ncbi:MAG: radical SAM family heme chaperone HemW [Chitinispirillaceae bacterium]|nr:radical SAM family heme chaperone HemW [Chitinispirillaceae bacterium]
MNTTIRVVRRLDNSMTPLSLYLHLPFCAKKCRYCDFYSVKPDKRLCARYLTSLAREIDRYGDHPMVRGAQVRTVFFGGGTPTVLSPDELAQLCGLVCSQFTLADAEWTVECNPESFTREKALVLLDHGVTRLTFGIQSLDDRELSLLGRIHSADRCHSVLLDPALTRFRTIGVDIIYGLPGQSVASLERTVSALLAFPVITHISAYEMTVADHTPFGRHRRLLPLPGDEALTVMTERLWQRLEEAGFEHYEISNFARPGHRCLHNEVYWDHAPWLGLGPAAHSYLRPQRWGNVRDLARYCDMVEAGEKPRGFVETLDTRMLAEEMLLMGLRRADGIDEERFAEKCGKNLEKIIDSQKLGFFKEQGLVRYEKPFWRPTAMGMLMADGMARELMAHGTDSYE